MEPECEGLETSADMSVQHFNQVINKNYIYFFSLNINSTLNWNNILLKLLKPRSASAS